MPLAEWDGLAPLAALVALVVLVAWPPEATPTALHGDKWADALEEGAAGQAMPWDDPASGEHGTVVPAAVFRGGNGLWCRRYEVSVIDNRGSQTSEHLACRLAGGDWWEQPERMTGVSPANGPQRHRQDGDQLAAGPAL